VHALWAVPAALVVLHADRRVPRRACALLRMTSGRGMASGSGRGALSHFAVGLKLVSLIPAVAEIFPFRVFGFDQLDFFFSALGFHFFFAADRGHYISMTFDVYEVGHIVFGSESFEGVGFVLEDAVLDVASHSDVEDAALAGKNVDVIELGHVCKDAPPAGNGPD